MVRFASWLFLRERPQNNNNNNNNNNNTNNDNNDNDNNDNTNTNNNNNNSNNNASIGDVLVCCLMSRMRLGSEAKCSSLYIGMCCISM